MGYVTKTAHKITEYRINDRTRPSTRHIITTMDRIWITTDEIKRRPVQDVAGHAKLIQDNSGQLEEHNSEGPENSQLSKSTNGVTNNPGLPDFSYKGHDEASNDPAVVNLRVRAAAKSNAAICKPFCACVCHRESDFALPKIISNMCGSFSFSYKGLCALTPNCNTASCGRKLTPTVSVTYNFPAWLLCRSIQASLQYRLGGVQMLLRAPQIVSYHSSAMRASREGNTNLIEQLFISGAATPWMVDEDGWTLLHWAASKNHLGLSAYLIEKGGDLFVKNLNFRRRPIDYACHNYFYEIPQTDVDRMQEVFEPLEEIKDLQFPLLHKAVLGLSGPLDIRSVFEHLDTRDINAFDSTGNTPLGWAVIRNDVDAVQVLLEHGADQGILNGFGGLQVHRAAHLGSLECLKLLCEWDSSQVNARNDFAATPLHAAASSGSLLSVEYLTSVGADLDAQDKYGRTPIMFAISENMHAVLKALIDLGVDRRVRTYNGETVLHKAISHGDLKTIEILINRAHDDLDINAKDADGDTPLDLLAYRKDTEVAEEIESMLIDAFSELGDSSSQLTSRVSELDDSSSELSEEETFYDVEARPAEESKQEDRSEDKSRSQL